MRTDTCVYIRWLQAAPIPVRWLLSAVRFSPRAFAHCASKPPPSIPLNAHMAQVNATSTAIEFVVRGGGLGDDVWVPANVMNVEDKQFIPLSRSDRRFQRYVLGSRPHLGGRSKTAPFAFNSFLDGLSALRNAAVDTLLLQHLQDQDPIANIVFVQKAARKDIDPA